MGSIGKVQKIETAFVYVYLAKLFSKCSARAKSLWLWIGAFFAQHICASKVILEVGLKRKSWIHFGFILDAIFAQFPYNTYLAVL